MPACDLPGPETNPAARQCVHAAHTNAVRKRPVFARVISARTTRPGRLYACRRGHSTRRRIVTAKSQYTVQYYRLSAHHRSEVEHGLLERDRAECPTYTSSGLGATRGSAYKIRCLFLYSHPYPALRETAARIFPHPHAPVY